MSVLSRKRSVSELEFYKNGKEIRAELTRYLMSEKHIPKRYTFIFTIPGVRLARKMMQYITAANTIYPKNEDDLRQRWNYQTKAIIKCEQMMQHIQWMIDTLDTVKPSDFIKSDESQNDKLAEKIIKEVSLLKAWRGKNKIMQQSSGENPKRD